MNGMKVTVKECWLCPLGEMNAGPTGATGIYCTQGDFWPEGYVPPPAACPLRTGPVSVELSKQGAVPGGEDDGNQ